MNLEIFGSWEKDEFGPPTYMVTALCSAKCHCMRTLIHPEAIDSARFIEYLWTVTLKNYQDAFREAHPDIEL